MSPSSGAVQTAVVVASDRCAAGEAVDHSGPRAVEILRAAGLDVAEPTVVPDGADSISGAIDAALRAGARVVITSGGTGVGPRDRTPEGTGPVLDRELPGLAEQIRRTGAEQVPSAVLSRGLAGVTDSGAVVVNLPGSVAGVEHGLGVLLPLVGHLLEQLRGGDHDGPAQGHDQHAHEGHDGHDGHDGPDGHDHRDDGDHR